MVKVTTKKASKKIKAGVERVQPSKISPFQARAIEQLKFSLCDYFVAYRTEHQLKQRQIAEKMGIAESLVSRILRYQVSDFSIDRLVKYLLMLSPKAALEILIVVGKQKTVKRGG